MSNRFGLSDSLLDAVKNITANGTKVDKHAAFGLTEMSSKEKMKRGLYNGKMDPVGKEDDDVDNDGDSDKSDDYLKNRRKAISKNMKGGVEINPTMKEEVKKSEGDHAFDNGLADAQKGRPRKNASDLYGPHGHRYDAGYSSHKTKMKEEVEEIDELSKKTLSSYSDKAKKTFFRKPMDNRQLDSRLKGVKTAAKKLAKEETKVDSGLENPHNCATHVYSESWGDGQTVKTMHAEPDQAGNIAWYDVMFEHGIEKGVPIKEIKVVKSESHLHNKRGNK